MCSASDIATDIVSFLTEFIGLIKCKNVMIMGTKMNQRALRFINIVKTTYEI